METFCSPFHADPFTETFISYCLTDIILFVSCTLLLFVTGFIRIVKIRRFKRGLYPYNKSHVFTLLASLIVVVVNGLHFIYLIVTDNGEIPSFRYLTTISWALVWVGSLFLAEYEFQHGVKHFWGLVAFWVLSGTLEGIRLQALGFESTIDVSDGSFWFLLAEEVFTVLLCFNALLYNEPPTEESDDDEVKLHDEKSALILEKRENFDNNALPIGRPKCGVETQVGIYSRLTFSWITPLLKKGFYTALIHDDLPMCVDEDNVNINARKFETKWEEQEATQTSSLVRALFRTFWREFLLAGLFKLANDAFIFSGPLILEQIIIFVEDPTQPLWHGLLWAAGMFLGTTLQSLAMQQYWQLVYRVGMKTKSALIAKVYSKSLRLSHRERQKSTVGQITNLQSVDVNAISGIVVFLHQLWSAPLQIIVSVGLLWRVMDLASLGGLAVLLVTLPIQIGVGRIMTKNQNELLKKKDERIKNTNEVLQGIRVIKFFAWEFSFLSNIKQLRWAELVVLRYGAFIRASITLLWSLTPLLVTLVTFSIYSALGNTLTSAVAFSSLALFNVMRFPLNILPSLITQLIEAQVSLHRLESFFMGEELDPLAIEEEITMESAISVENGNFEWAEGRPVLQNIDINIPRGSLIAIVGEVGSGKSSLLNAILGEMPKVSGRVVVNGTISYVPQNAWIKNATVKQNILFLNEEDDNKYRLVVKAAQLLPDLEVLPGKDQTEIGEKGINLSGGQKQRISMARAIYSDTDIYVLDDPLSAVDAHVGKALFNECIKGLLAKKTRILVTHQLQYLRQCDQIILLKGGVISEIGTYAELMNNGMNFSELINKHVGERGEDEEEGEISRKNKEPEEKPDTGKGKPDGPKVGGKPGGPGGPGGKPGGLMSTEGREAGGVKGYVYLQYIQSIGGFLMAATLIFLYTAQTGSVMTADYWLSYWSVVGLDSSNTTGYTTGRSLTEFGFGTEKIYNELGLGVYFYLMVYGIITSITAALILGRSFLLAQAGVNASKSIHNAMLERVLRAPTSYYDTVPVGRILNRFSSDQNVIDVTLPRTLGMAFDTVLTSIAVIFVIASVTPAFLVSLLSLSFLYRYVQKYYLRSSREIQRLSTISRSPIYALFGETLNGLATIRAYGKQEKFRQDNESRVERANQAEYAGFTANRWMGVRLEFVGSVIVFAASFFAVVGRNTIDPGLAGLSVSYALRLTSNLNWLVRMSTDVENNLISVERCVQYSKLETERDYKSEFELPPNWPDKGNIKFSNLKLRYRDGLPLVLKGINAEIRSREKIGIVGRTGSGKSSLMLALFRIVEHAEGTIIIDGQDINTLGLHDLRSRLAIIPQDPTLFTGTIRSNLDPFHNHSDNQLWNALTAVEMAEQIKTMDGQLEARVSEYGENLSVGTRQLLCLARALLKRCKILVMDEATANVDFETDALIQKAIRREFQDVTVLMIAHRINTIMDSSRVLVLDAGVVSEFDTPEVLLNNESSLFYGLAKEAGIVSGSKKQEVEDLLIYT